MQVYASVLTVSERLKPILLLPALCEAQAAVFNLLRRAILRFFPQWPMLHQLDPLADIFFLNGWLTHQNGWLTDLIG